MTKKKKTIAESITGDSSKNIATFILSIFMTEGERSIKAKTYYYGGPKKPANDGVKRSDEN